MPGLRSQMKRMGTFNGCNFSDLGEKEPTCIHGYRGNKNKAVTSLFCTPFLLLLSDHLISSQEWRLKWLWIGITAGCKGQ
jgi:hypothetical protein